MFTSKNPYTGEILKIYSVDTQDQVLEKIKQAYKTYHLALSQPETLQLRSESLLKLKGLLLEDIEGLSLLISEEMGKSKNEAQEEIKKCAHLCEYYVNLAPKVLQPQLISVEGLKEAYVSYQPLGVILGVMPWNFPFWQVFRFAVPSLLSGNSVLLKHSSNVQGCALKMQELFHKAGFEKKEFQNLSIKSDHIKSVLQNDSVAAVSLTGSEHAGRSVARLAGENLKPCVLELGGSDPYILCEDLNADSLKKALEVCIKARLVNSGQSCISPKRIFIHEKHYDHFKKELVKRVKNYGFHTSPKNHSPSPSLAPMAREDLRNELHDLIDSSVKKGAKLLAGGHLPKLKSYHYPITILEDIPDSAPASHEELFGPVFCLYKYKDFNEALEKANGTRFGLGAAVFSEDLSKAKEVSEKHLLAGICAINGFVKSNQSLPFGGVKASGFGRELSSDGLLAFTNKKSVMVF